MEVREGVDDAMAVMIIIRKRTLYSAAKQCRVLIRGKGGFLVGTALLHSPFHMLLAQQQRAKSPVASQKIDLCEQRAFELFGEVLHIIIYVDIRFHGTPHFWQPGSAKKTEL